MDMRILKYLFFILFVVKINGSERTTIRSNFIISFLNYEIDNPILLISGLCWKKGEKVNLIVDLSKAGYRSAQSMDILSVYEYHRVIFVADMSCRDVEDIMDNVESRKLFAAPFRWLVFTNSSHDLDLLSDKPLFSDSDLVVAEETTNGYKLLELYKPSPNISMQITVRGYYNGSLFDVRSHREKFRRRRDVMGHPLTMTNVIQDSSNSRYRLPREDELHPQDDAISKLCWSTAKLAFQMLNATPKYIFNTKWGYKRNGSWDGVIDDILSDRAVLGTNMFLTKERMDVIQYTDAILNKDNMKFIFRQPPLSYTVSNIFVLPFSINVWLAILVCVVIYICTLTLASKWEAQFRKTQYQPDGQIVDAWLLVMAAVAQQGCFFEPRFASGRIMIWVFFTAFMTLFAAYCANIIVLLQGTSDVKTIEQLVNSKITLGAQENVMNQYWLRHYNGPVSSKLMKKLEPDSVRHNYYNLTEGVEKIRQGMFAFHYIVEPLYRRIEETFHENEKCDLVEVDLLNHFDPFMPAKKDSPYLELLRVVLKQIRESGIKNVLLSRMQVRKPRCSSAVSVYNSVGITDTRPVLILMVLGIFVSVGILFIEIMIFKIENIYFKKKERRQTKQ